MEQDAADQDAAVGAGLETEQRRSIDALRTWFTANGGYLDPRLQLMYSPERGQHVVASSAIAASEDAPALLCKCPLSLSLSFLNVEAAPPAGVRPCAASSAVAHLVGRVERAALSCFLLCEQRLLGTRSFWAAYIACLPRESDMATPWWFADRDLLWLLGTNVHLSAEAERSGVEMRRGMWKAQWEEGVRVLKAAGVDVEEYTWELYLWAATIFSSRSFASRIFSPSVSEPSGQQSFPLLYPVVDSFNHRFGAKVLWNMDNGDFQMSVAEPAQAGEEVFNNYAPKGNEELLTGYGFCIPNNPCDEVAMRIGRPPDSVHTLLRSRYPERFASAEWADTDAVFFLRGSDHYSGGYQHAEPLLRGLPPELIGTLGAILDHSYRQQGVELEQHHLEPAAVDAILERLAAKHQGIRQWDDQLPAEPQNDRQRFAKMYRDGQLAIMEEIMAELQQYLDRF
ncbi:uncharacterized protein PV09_06610 [Verruconis gallopava]|uniref:SET domain-containing protein n=1 Tax=Verruconis gallopava TaxID=253628 RepID=A0A0D2A6C9_9PEZI|nr:uncharacterized protein PV09_06610 [Verruconis gallopava]KIW02120.1 hypothetical protein PV09_06610 [Verruconis gallopava]